MATRNGDQDRIIIPRKQRMSHKPERQTDAQRWRKMLRMKSKNKISGEVVLR